MQRTDQCHLWIVYSLVLTRFEEWNFSEITVGVAGSAWIRENWKWWKLEFIDYKIRCTDTNIVCIDQVKNRIRYSDA